MTKTGAQILWECLEREGVKHVFGYPGGAILPAYDALKHSDIHHILVRHEQGATHMADGYARASGDVGVAVATSGPGRDQHGDRHRHRDAGFFPDRLYYRPSGQQADRLRRFSGNRHHRHHPAHHQAQLPRHSRRPIGARVARSVLRGPLRPSRSGAGRYHQGRAAIFLRIRLGGRRGRSCPAIVPICLPRRRSTRRRWS